MSLEQDRRQYMMDFDSSYVVYRRPQVGYINRGKSNNLIPKVSKSTLKIMKKLLTPTGINKTCMKKKPYKLIKTITRL